jgi:hypothetical protein
MPITFSKFWLLIEIDVVCKTIKLQQLDIENPS